MNNEIDSYPVRQDITVIPADSKKLRLGWVIHVIPPHQSVYDYYKERLSPEEFADWEYKTSYLRGQESDRADVFRGNGDHVEKPKCQCNTTIDVLPQLWGMPWNNLALNYIHTLRPSFIRVSMGMWQSDAVPWRVSVCLEKDNKTIKKITQEVVIGGYGQINATPDLNSQLRYQKEHGNMEGFVQSKGEPHIYINDYALSQIDVKDS